MVLRISSVMEVSLDNASSITDLRSPPNQAKRRVAGVAYHQPDLEALVS